MELVFDGKTATLSGKNNDAYRADRRRRLGRSAHRPAARQILNRGARRRPSALAPYDELTADAIDAKHIGQGVIDGVECEHLAFRTPELDWQIWIEIGARPIPRKYVITSKTVTGAPQYTLRIKEWNTDAQIAADAFVFKAPADAKQVEVAILTEFDEVPRSAKLWEEEMTRMSKTSFVSRWRPPPVSVLFAADRMTPGQLDRPPGRRPRRPSAHADELCRRGAANDAPRCLCRRRRCGTAAAAYYGTGCYQTTDAYGRIYTQCP